MPSWQSHLVKAYFQFQRFLHPPTGILDVEEARINLEKMAANFKTRAGAVCTPADANHVPAEWIATAETSPERAILYLHGGSYNSGSIKTHRALAANIAQAAKCRVLIIDYRMAPENPFPAAVEDAARAYRWLLENQVEPGQLIIAGDSAGGGLALSLLVHLRDSGESLPAAAVCISPWTDLTCSGESWKTNAKKDILLDPGELVKSAQLYLASADPRTPLASPLYADLRGLPPIFIQAGSDELLLSDATCFADRLRAAGVDVTLEVWEGMQHEWHFAAEFLPEGRDAVNRIGHYIENHMSN